MSDTVDFEDEIVDDPADFTLDEVRDVLCAGELTVVGRLTAASNLSLLVHAALEGVTFRGVYKPTRGERPLWDFPDGTLAEREYASAIINEAAGWHCVPPTYLRNGPLGFGMVQLWISGTDETNAVDLFTPAELPQGWRPVLRAVDQEGHPIVLAHADQPQLATLAAFDLVVNNADRKAGHILPVPSGPWYGVDHGLTMHADDKVRTVLWGWAGEPFDEGVMAGLAQLTQRLAAGELSNQLSTLLTQSEIAALATRVDVLSTRGTFSDPPVDRPAIPWPPI